MSPRQRRFRHSYNEELPLSIANNIVYVIGKKNHLWLLAFKCPCGCENLTQLNLLKEASPQWTFIITKKGWISISPSIWKKRDCKSHFHIKNGKIIWARDFEEL